MQGSGVQGAGCRGHGGQHSKPPSHSSDTTLTPSRRETLPCRCARCILADLGRAHPLTPPCPTTGSVTPHLYVQCCCAPLLADHVLPDRVALKRHLLLLLPPQHVLRLADVAVAAHGGIPAEQQTGDARHERQGELAAAADALLQVTTVCRLGFAPTWRSRSLSA